MAARDPWFDNMRWLAGSLVVVIHFTGALATDTPPGEVGNLVDWFHSAFYPFRLPLFALLVGYFSHVEPNAHHYNSLIRTIVLPVAAISLLHLLLTLWQSGEWRFDPVAAQYTLWFMYGVILWRAAAPYIMRLRTPFILSIVFSLVSGIYASLWVFGLYSVTGLTPFFVLGLLMRRNDSWLRRRTPLKTTAALLVLVAWFVGVTIMHLRGLLDRALLGMTQSYESEVMPGIAYEMGTRLLLLTVSGIAMFAALYLAPRRHLPIISYVGAGGFTIYLLHGLVIRLINLIQPSPLALAEEWWQMLLQIAGGFVLALILGSKPVRWLVRPIVRPKVKWLLRPESESATTSPRAKAAAEPQRGAPPAGDTTKSDPNRPL